MSEKLELGEREMLLDDWASGEFSADEVTLFESFCNRKGCPSEKWVKESDFNSLLEEYYMMYPRSH